MTLPKSTLQVYYDKHGRLPTKKFPEKIKPLIKENKALKIFK